MKAIGEGVQLHQHMGIVLNNVSFENNSIEFQYFQKFLNEISIFLYQGENEHIYDEELNWGTIDMRVIQIVH